MTASESSHVPSTNVLREMTTVAEHLAAQLEETRGNEYRLRLARACALALCDSLHAFEASK
jgi:hypothetical protein